MFLSSTSCWFFSTPSQEQHREMPLNCHIFSKRHTANVVDFTDCHHFCLLCLQFPFRPLEGGITKRNTLPSTTYGVFAILRRYSAWSWRQSLYRLQILNTRFRFSCGETVYSHYIQRQMPHLICGSSTQPVCTQLQ